MRLKNILNMKEYLNSPKYNIPNAKIKYENLYELKLKTKCKKIIENENFIAVTCDSKLLVIWKEGKKINIINKFENTTDNINLLMDINSN